MSNDNLPQPSAEDMSKALVAARTLAKCANVAEMSDDLAKIIARVRREARAEAFKEADRGVCEYGKRRFELADSVAALAAQNCSSIIRALAAKERAS